jgi:peptide-methionine (R)-S-oxide reductase
LLAAIGCGPNAVYGQSSQNKALSGLPKSSPKRADKVVLSEATWHKRLNDSQFNILRESGTERAFTGKYADFHETGVFNCAGCGLPLFESKTKFESGTGWPSFYKPIDKNVWLKTDLSFGEERIEVRCSRCDGHLGHVFDDAPQTPTGLRFCMNSDALQFKKHP